MPEIAAFDTPEVEFFAKKNACSQQALTDLNCLVPKVGLEPTLCHHNRILSPARLPFRHFGKERRQFMQTTFHWWAVQGSNLRPLPCEGNALPLS
jgi:hypothetical protein